MLILWYTGKKKGARDQMEWATAHFQFCVATLQWYPDKTGAARTTCALVRMTEDLRASVRVLEEACRDSPPWVLCRDMDF